MASSSILNPYRRQNLSSMHVENLAMSHVSAQVPRETSNANDAASMSPFHLPPAIILLAFLPIPPLLSLLYLTTGHAILGQIHKSSLSSIYHTPILSSVEAGATGGLIFSIPAVLLLYFFIFYNRQSSVPEDFFEDDDSVTTGSARWMMYVGYLACILFVIGIGGIAGPLGVTCLSSDILTALVMTKKMLSVGAAAGAGFLGGVVLSAAILLLGVLATLVWSFWMRRKHLSS